MAQTGLRLGKITEKNMKIWRKLNRAFNYRLFLLILGLLILPVATLAASEVKETNPNIYLPEGTVYENLYYAVGQNITLNAQMKDDVYLAGANIVISGPVGGDLMIVGSNVIINSDVNGDIRVAAGSVTINGKVSGNVLILAGMVSLGQNSEIGKNLVLLGGQSDVSGKINKNLYAGVGDLLLNNEIMGSVYLTVSSDGSLVLQPLTNIHGNLEYSAPKTAEIMAGAKIQSEEKFTQLSVTDRMQQRKNQGPNLFFWFAGLLGAIIVGLVTVWLFKDQTGKVLTQFETKIPLNILKGLVCFIVAPIALLILAVTIIGFPLAMIVGSFYLVAIYISRIFIGLYLGRLVLKNIFKQNEPQPIWAMMLGLLLIYILCLLPILGFFVKLVIAFWGLGVLMSVSKKELKLENN